MPRQTAEEIQEIVQQRDWWKRLAEAYGMKLYGWNGPPPSSASFYAGWPQSPFLIEIPGALATAMHEMAVKAGVINEKD